jgi:hypothetical protein
MNNNNSRNSTNHQILKQKFINLKNKQNTHMNNQVNNQVNN